MSTIRAALGLLTGSAIGKSIEGFKVRGWGPEEERKVTYRFDEGNTKLTVTIEDVETDYFDPDKLLLFLSKKGVISNRREWRLENIDDTSGNTMIDDLWCTAVFRRTVAP